MPDQTALSIRAIVRNPYVLAYLGLYAVLLTLLHGREGFGLALPLFIMIFIGVGFSAAVLLATRGRTAPALPIKNPRLESALLVFYLIVIVGGYLAWAMPLLGKTFEAGSAAGLFAVLGKKLILFVIVPFLMFRFLWGYRLGDLADLTFLWVLIEVGLVEELPYRVLLQSRLAALLKSELGGMILMIVIFGLTHAPGLYFRAGETIEALGSSPSPLMAIGYSIVVISVVSWFLGFLWIRTRNLPLLMVVHAAFDLIPKVPTVAKAFFQN
jgi:membrane protease YdiL (CAAX protease family)